MAEYLATGQPDMQAFLAITKTMMANATADFAAIGKASNAIIGEFKSG